MKRWKKQVPVIFCSQNQLFFAYLYKKTIYKHKNLATTCFFQIPNWHSSSKIEI